MIVGRGKGATPRAATQRVEGPPLWAMNRIGNLWRSTAGQLGATVSGLLKQTCPGTQVVSPRFLSPRVLRSGASCLKSLALLGRLCRHASALQERREETRLTTCVLQRDLVRLRLQRFGVRNNPFYRIVAADSRWPRDGKHLELLGTNARKHTGT